MTLPDVACSPGATIAVLFEEFKRSIASWQSLTWVSTNYQNFETPIPFPDLSRRARHFAFSGRAHDVRNCGRLGANWPGFGSNTGDLTAVSSYAVSSISIAICPSITP